VAALCGVLALLAAGLGTWGLTERAQRLALAARVGEPAPAPAALPANSVAELPQAVYRPAPDDYLHLRRLLEQDPLRWLASVQTDQVHPIQAQPPAPAILSPASLLKSSALN
jgi:hypothetical protein